MLRRLRIGWMLRPTCLMNVRHRHWPSRLVRSTFINFFQDQDHQFVRSSPVIPWNDSSLAFVNAGMNQFKPVFLGQSPRPCASATNSQKCIRVGGKHNDLSDVGLDTYHHTFFEMLGNWSFGDYFKSEACKMAWMLLTEVYRLPPDRLYVTYFGGDAALNLSPDFEVQEIWRLIGVPEDRILPFGFRDNFWEMGAQGPCGPCTEIHYDHLGRVDSQKSVNLGVEGVIELWNLVFMQYERLIDGSLQPLPMHHVDTGMGLERITAVLNSQSSNYDTDLFTPIFKKIEQMSGRVPYKGKFSADGQCIDTAYRILADHMRMVTVALADGLFPEDSHKLRRVMRRAMLIGRDRFGFSPEQRNLVELTRIIAESLGDAYPELWSQLEKVQIIIHQEEENFLELHHKVLKDWKYLLKQHPLLEAFSDVISTGLVSALKEISPMIEEWKNTCSTFPNDVAIKLVDAYGLNIDVVEDLARINKLDIDIGNVQKELENMKSQRENIERQKWNSGKFRAVDMLPDKSVFQNLPATDDSAKYKYEHFNDHYLFEPLETKVLSLVCDGQLADSVACGKTVGVILNCTNFYHEAGGQDSDRGELVSEDLHFKVKYVEKIGHVLVHWGVLEFGELSAGKKLIACIDSEYRLGCMQHHTATHLLNSAIRAVTGVSCQRSSHVSSDYLSLGVRMYQTMDYSNIQEAEKIVKMWVQEKCSIHRRTVLISELLQDPRINFLPGEVYPDNVHVVTTNLKAPVNTSSRGTVQISSVEPCCGTHVLNTGDIGNFCIIDVKAAGVGLRTLRALCGEKASIAEANAEIALCHLQKWKANVEKEIAMGHPDRIANTAKDLITWYSTFGAKPMPYLARIKVNSTVDELGRLLRNALRGDANKQMVMEMEDVIRRKPLGPVIHLLETDFGTSKAILNKASKICKDQPAVIFALAEGTVIGRATLPKDTVNKGASAAEWLMCIQQTLGGTIKAPRSQDCRFICNFRGRRMNSVEMEKLKEAVLACKDYIDKYS